LIILQRTLPPREVVPDSDTLEIGRAPRGSSSRTLVISDGSVSRRHAVIHRREGDLILEDAGSTLGTFINDRPLETGEGVALHDGDVMRLGRVEVVCRFDTEPLDPGEAMRNAAFASQANARLILLEGNRVRRFALAAPGTLVGCAGHCDVRLADRGGPPEQALMRAVGGGYRLESRSAASPPRLDERQTPVVAPVPLPAGSVLLLHQAQALFLYDFGEDGRPVADPLRALSRRELLRGVAEQSGHSRGVLSGLCRGRSVLGQCFGEILVEKGLVTPLTWRVLSRRLLSRRRPGWRWLRQWKEQRTVEDPCAAD
jgi:hypothetical protein